MHDQTPEITELIVKAAERARRETETEPEPELTQKIKWPVECTVGPGLEGAIACESEIGYVNGSKGWLIYRGYDIFDLAAHSSFEEVSYLLLHGKLPAKRTLERFKKKLVAYRSVDSTLRQLMGIAVEKMSPMAALRIGIMLMRRDVTDIDIDANRPEPTRAIQADEDSIPMETKPMGEEHAIYEFKKGKAIEPRHEVAAQMESCYQILSGSAGIAAAIARLRQGKLPIEPDPELSFAANYLYMMTGRVPTPVEERIMDVALILHADHGMNASTFASMVVASTLSDVYFSVGAGVAALNGPLHGGANEMVIQTLNGIGEPDKAEAFVEKARKNKDKIMGFGHRVYKAYDPRARILHPLAREVVKGDKEARRLLKTAEALEKAVLDSFGREKKIFPNVDFFSGITYSILGIPTAMFTPTFAVSRVAGWTARIMEYLEDNRIFRPRAMYVGPFDKQYVPIDERGGKGKRRKKT